MASLRGRFLPLAEGGRFMRRCGDCQLCCNLLPVRELNKGAGQRFRFQKFHKGCTVYHRPEAGFPMCCGLWSCAWLIDPEGTADFSRPDRSHYVVDIMPDYVTLTTPGEAPINL